MDDENSVRTSPTMNARQSHMLILVFLAILSAKTAEGTNHQNDEQTHFRAEDDGVKRPVTIPQDALIVLSRDKLVRDVLENQNIPAAKIPASWFSASTTHLGSVREIDLIVMSVGPVRGANVTLFWAFRPAATGHELIFAGGGHDLIVKGRRTNG